MTEAIPTKWHCNNGSNQTCLRKLTAIFQLQLLILTTSTLVVTANSGTTGEPLRSLFIDENLTQNAPRPHGTLNGFDVGGPDSICFVSQLINASSGAANGLDVYGEHDENDVLFWNATQDEARLLPSCPLNTSLQIQGTAFDPQWPDTLFTGQPYDFQINLSMTIPNASPLLVDFQRNSRLHFRLVLCNALLRGSCSPVIDFNYQKVIWDPYSVQQNEHADDSNQEDKRKEQTPLLTGVANTKQRAIASPFVRYYNEDMVVLDTDSSTKEPQHQTILEAALKVQFQIPHNVQFGTYIFIAHAKLLAKDSETDTLQRLDIAASLPQFSIQVEHPPNIQRITRGQKIGLAVASGLVGLASLAALVFIIYHRNHSVMKLAQAPFLMALLMCVLIASTFCFTLMPEINSYCFLRGLLVDLPAATSAAILLARCWRVHVTLCNANTFGRSARTATRSGRQFCRSEPIPFGQYTVDALTFLAKLPGRLGKLFTTIASTNPWKVSSADAAATTTTTTTPSPRSRSLSLRQTATAAETASLSVLLAMPELVLQVLGITLAEPRLELQYDDKAEIGRYTCQSDTRWVQKAGLAWMGVLLVTAVTVAWAGRDLPQAFNEKTAIFNTASICAVILLVSLVFTGITDDPQTAPFVPLFLGCLNIFGLSIAILFNIVLPKILRVLSGEKVVLTHLLARYNQQTAGGLLLEDGSTGEDYRRSMLVLKASSTNGTNSGRALSSTAVYSPGAVVKLKRDDPLPRKLENGIYDVQGLLGQVSRLCGEGRTPSTLHWNKMRRTVAQLKMELDMVELDWSSEDDNDNDADHDDEGGPTSSSMPISIGTSDHTVSSPQDNSNGNV